MENDKIGQRIKTLRKSKGITQEQLSEEINVSPHYIYEIERGLKQMSLETFMSVARLSCPRLKCLCRLSVIWDIPL